METETGTGIMTVTEIGTGTMTETEIKAEAETGAAGKALIAMSGGVDSCVAALLAQRAGYDCAGVTLLLLDDEDGIEREGRACLAQSEARDAARAAEALGIQHYVFDFSREFRDDVIDRFADAYANGTTPNPCLDCNAYLKFGLLMDTARRMGFDKLVTGHYARIVRAGEVQGARDAHAEPKAKGTQNESGAQGGRNAMGVAYGRDPEQFLLMRPAYREKDQTYFLYMLTQDQLAHTLFPLADLTKQQVRELAATSGLPTAAKRDSQDICFVHGGEYTSFLKKYQSERDARSGLEPGLFVDAEGNVLGRHEGIARYTIGQRKGVGVALGKPIFVAEIRAESNEIVLSTDEASLYRGTIDVRDINWISGSLPDGPVRADVQVRYGAAPAPATIYFGGLEGGPVGSVSGSVGSGSPGDSSGPEDAPVSAKVRFDKPVRAPARGQAAVFYDGDIVLGGGRIV